jgi:hypothetical protein
MLCSTTCFLQHIRPHISDSTPDNKRRCFCGTKNILFENKINARLFGKDVDFFLHIIIDIVMYFILSYLFERFSADPKIVGVSNVNLSILKQGKVKAIWFSTLNAICEAFDCQPGDILEYVPDNL